MNLKYQFKRVITSFVYLMNHMLYEIFKMTLITLSKKKREALNDNPLIIIYINKIEN